MIFFKYNFNAHYLYSCLYNQYMTYKPSTTTAQLHLLSLLSKLYVQFLLLQWEHVTYSLCERPPASYKCTLPLKVVLSFSKDTKLFFFLWSTDSSYFPLFSLQRIFLFFFLHYSFIYTLHFISYCARDVADFCSKTQLTQSKEGVCLHLDLVFGFVTCLLFFGNHINWHKRS